MFFNIPCIFPKGGINSLIADVGWLILGIKAILLVFVYIMTIVVFSLTVEEKKALWRLSNKIIKK